MKKYILSDERKVIRTWNGRIIVLYRIKAISEFTTFAIKRKQKFTGEKKTIFYQIEPKKIEVGQSGGYVQSERNLSQSGTCWIDDNAIAYEDAIVKDDAYLGGSASIGGKVKLYGNTKVTDKVQIGGKIRFGGRSKVVGEGTYYDEGTFENLFLGSERTKPKNPQKESSPQGKIKIECEFGEKRFVNSFEF